MSQSPIEVLFREAASRLWPGTLVREHPVSAGGKSYRLDFAVPSLKKGIELDGHATHSSPGDIARDRERKRALEDAGWQVRYYGGQEVTRDADRVVRDAISWCGLKARVDAHCPTCNCRDYSPSTWTDMNWVNFRLEAGECGLRCGKPGYKFYVLPGGDRDYVCRDCGEGKKTPYQSDREQYLDELRQCRKLCLRALVLSSWLLPTADGAYGVSQEYHASVCLRFLPDMSTWTPPEYARKDTLSLLADYDAAGYWDLYENRYDYTDCVLRHVNAKSPCEHRDVNEETVGCHCAVGVHCPNNCGHQWYVCVTCGIRFPQIGQETAWLACEGRGCL
ncbi:MAG TPA: DUF559 domain-containing protein [Trebonia sp.]